jgi:Uncharacterized protein conserved in bacteria (DUF2188)
MAKRTQFHVVPKSGTWQLQRDGQPVASFDTKDNALTEGRKQARANQPSQLIVHTADGKIEDEATYQDDPHPPAG